jgi:ferredoxin-NADP reductase
MAEYLFPLQDRREIADGTMAFWFDTLSTDFDFKAGQFADFTLMDPPHMDAEGNSRTFSLASSPGEKGTVMVATRMRDTAFKNSLKEIPLGTKVRVEGPMGSFTLHKDIERPAVFLAGGIGITPMHSMIRWATEEKLPYVMTLFYSNPTPQATTFLRGLEAWGKKNKNLTLALTVTDSEDVSWPYEFGRVNEEMLRKYIPNSSLRTLSLSAPTRSSMSRIAATIAGGPAT